LAYVFYYELSRDTEEEDVEEIGEKELTRPIISHTMAQKLLVELGNLLGYDTYVPPEDYNKKVNGKTLGELATLKEIPPFTYPKTLETVKHIDVMWFEEEFPKYCFEVEDSTDVIKGLLRLYRIRQLQIVSVIVGPESKRSKFLREIEKDPFHKLKDKYRFISYEELEELFQTAERFFELKKRLLD